MIRHFVHKTGRLSVILLLMMLADACGDCDDFETTLLITGVENRSWFSTDSRDSGQVHFTFSLKSKQTERKMVSSSFGMLTGTALATEDCADHERFFYENPLDSVRISANQPFSDPNNYDVTNAFIWGENETSLPEFSKWHPNTPHDLLTCTLNTEPFQSDSFYFTFQFFDVEGNEFVSTTEKVYVR